MQCAVVGSHLKLFRIVRFHSRKEVVRECSFAWEFAVERGERLEGEDHQEQISQSPMISGMCSAKPQAKPHTVLQSGFSAQLPVVGHFNQDLGLLLWPQPHRLHMYTVGFR